MTRGECSGYHGVFPMEMCSGNAYQQQMRGKRHAPTEGFDWTAPDSWQPETHIPHEINLGREGVAWNSAQPSAEPNHSSPCIELSAPVLTLMHTFISSAVASVLLEFVDLLPIHQINQVLLKV